MTPDFNALDALRGIAAGEALFSPGTAKLRVLNISLYTYRSFPIRGFHSLCRQAGVESHALFLKNSRGNFHLPVSDKEMAMVLDLVRTVDPDLIAISVLHPYVVVTRDLVAALRPVTRAPIVVGGKHPTVFPEAALDYGDYACRGEGELAMLTMLDRLAKGQDFRGIPGLWYRDEAGQVVDMGVAPLVKELDLIPFPALGDPDMHFIERNHHQRIDPEIEGGVIHIMAGRGCVYQCTYCVNALLTPMYRGNGKQVRLRSVENVVAEVVEARRKIPDARHVCFHDEVFAMYGEWLARFRDLYKSEVGLPFECELVPKLIREDNIRILADAGLTEMGFGIQSGDEHVRTVVMRRPGDNEELVAKATILHAHGVHGRYDLILDNPFETEQELEEAIDLLMRFPQPLQLYTYKMQYFPGYPFTLAALEKGYIEADSLSDEAVAQSTMYNWNFKPHMTLTRRNQLQNALYVFSLNSPLLRRLTLRLRTGRAPLAGLTINVAAWLHYQYNVCHNPILIWGRRGVIAVRMVASGDFSTLTRLAGRVLRRFRTAQLSR